MSNMFNGCGEPIELGSLGFKSAGCYGGENKNSSEAVKLLSCLVFLVAGAGFEPTTSGL